MKQNPCPMPNCERNILPTSKYGVCRHHDDLIETILYVLNRVRRQQPSKSGIVLPGQVGFSMSKKE